MANNDEHVYIVETNCSRFVKLKETLLQPADIHLES
jgi:hypothetical protein